MGWSEALCVLVGSASGCDCAMTPPPMISPPDTLLGDLESGFCSPCTLGTSLVSTCFLGIPAS